MKDCRQRVSATNSENEKCYNEYLRHQRQSERLQQASERFRRESEVHRQEEEKLRPTVNAYIQKTFALDAEQDQIEEQGRQVMESDAQLKERRDEIEDQRAIAKKRFDELSNGSI
jgi:chromosome segregation ATPase